MLNAAILSIIEEAGTAVMILTEGLEEEAFLSSRLTRTEVVRQIRVMTDIAANLPVETRSLLAELDWDGWESTARMLDQGGSDGEDALWFAVRSLVPAMLMWLRVYRQSLPDLFVCKPQNTGAK